MFKKRLGGGEGGQLALGRPGKARDFMEYELGTHNSAGQGRAGACDGGHGKAKRNQSRRGEAGSLLMVGF